MVFLWHAQFLHWLQLGYAGVGFFYILSGFILTYVYFSKLRHGATNSVQVKRFYVARIAKLYPVHILTFFAALPLVLPAIQYIFPDHTKASFLGAALSNLSLTQSWVPSNSVNFSFNGVAWSISVEMFFYLLFPLAILLVSKYHRFFTIKRSIVVMIGLWATLVLLLAPQQAVIDQWNFYIFPIMRLPDFIMGVLIGNIFLRLRHSAVATYNLERIKHWTRLEVLAMLMLVMGLLLGTLMPQPLRFAVWLMPFWSVLIFVYAQQRGHLSRLLQWRPLVFLGEASFSFYMTHQLIIRYIYNLGLSKISTAIISLGVAVLVSSMVYLYVEEPSRIRLKNFLEKRFIKNREPLPNIVQIDERVETGLAT